MDKNALKQMLESKIEVYYTKNPEINREREAEREQLIRWITEQTELGPEPGGLRQEIEKNEYP